MIAHRLLTNFAVPTLAIGGMACCLSVFDPSPAAAQTKFEQGLMRDRLGSNTNNFGNDWQGGWQGGASWLGGNSSQQQDWRLGVRVDNTETGAVIREVTPNSAGDRARLEVGDLIIAVGGFQIGMIEGRLYDLGDELRRRADASGIVTLLVQDHRNGQIASVRVQLDASQSVLSGTLVYRERISLPPDAIVTVQIDNLSRPYAVLRGGQVSYRAINSGTIPFEIAYDQSYLSPQDIYQVRASVSSGGREIFTTPQPQRVLTQGNPISVRLDLVTVGSSSLTSIPGSVVTASYPNYNALDEQIAVLYRRYLNRLPSNAELAALRISSPNLANRINTLPIELMAAQEYFDASGNNNPQWLRRVFTEVVGKAPTQVEGDQWMQRFAELRFSRTELLRQLYSQAAR
jgi:uncharacterized lipoprotein YbaY